jgi:adenylosuccinate lyase
MTDGERLTAIFDRLGKIDRDLAQHSALMTGELARVGDRLEGLDERVRIQNGRVTRAEGRLSELETQARIAHSHQIEDDEAAKWWKDKGAAIAIGSLLAVIGGVVGHLL